jgi:hypothetical protein
MVNQDDFWKLKEHPDGTISMLIVYFGQPATIACDAKCEKAWGIQLRPRHYFVPEEQDPDDYAFLADGELGQAPKDTGNYEGGDAKPRSPDQRLNKWCARQCERCKITPPGSPDIKLELHDFSKRLANKPARRT